MAARYQCPVCKVFLTLIAPPAARFECPKCAREVTLIAALIPAAPTITAPASAPPVPQSPPATASPPRSPQPTAAARAVAHPATPASPRPHKSETVDGCPTEDELRAFEQGYLPETRIDSVTAHLEAGCRRCESLLAKLGTGDDLGNALRGG